MVGMKEFLSVQMDACQVESSWFTSLKDSLKGLTFEQAAWTANEKSNSIWSTVQHLAYWSEVYLEKYKPGTIGEIEPMDNHHTFDIKEEITEENWEKAKARLETVWSRWNEVFSENIGKLDEGNWLKVIAGFTLHNAYHIGQIVTIRKLQGSWTDSGL